jgi:hypothetical protein
LNLAALAIFFAAWLQGWVTLVLDADITHMSVIIAIVFVVGWIICTTKTLRCSREMNAVRDDEGNVSRVRWYRDLIAAAQPEARGALADCLRSRLYARISVVRTISNNLITLGLIGTVIGFIIALSGVDAQAIADVGTVAPMVSTLIKGMSVALVTTLVGSVFHVWLLMCYQVLGTGTVNLANTIIERAEAPDHFKALDIL